MNSVAQTDDHTREQDTINSVTDAFIHAHRHRRIASVCSRRAVWSLLGCRYDNRLHTGRSILLQRLVLSTTLVEKLYHATNNDIYQTIATEQNL